MNAHEWVVVVAFLGAIYGMSFVSPEAAMLLAGVVAVAAFVRGDVTKKVLGG